MQQIIKLILFDLGGVLFTNGTKVFIQHLAETAGTDPEVVTEIIDGDIGTQYREAKITRYEFWENVIGGLNLSDSADELEKEWISYYELIEPTKEIILKLRENYQVYYLSDNVKERVEALDKRFGFKSWFDGGVFSHEAGVRKPNPKIYEYALEKAGVDAEEAIFIDDKYEALDTAKKMGMTVFLFSDPDLLKQQLSGAGLLDEE